MVDKRRVLFFREQLEPLLATRVATHSGAPQGTKMELRQLRGLLDAREVLDIMIRERVDQARQEGDSWEAIASAIGANSRQAAQKRFRPRATR